MINNYTKEEIKNSIECKWWKKQIYFLLGIVGILFIIFLAASLYVGLETADFSLILSIIGCTFGINLIILGPMLIYYLYQYYKIIKNYEKYEKYIVLLDKPSTSWHYRGAVYYTVSFVTGDNERKVLDTKPLFSSSLFSGFDLKDYNNKKINILYDSLENKVICINLVK